MDLVKLRKLINDDISNSIHILYKECNKLVVILEITHLLKLLCSLNSDTVKEPS